MTPHWPWVLACIALGALVTEAWRGRRRLARILREELDPDTPPADAQQPARRDQLGEDIAAAGPGPPGLDELTDTRIAAESRRSPWL